MMYRYTVLLYDTQQTVADIINDVTSIKLLRVSHVVMCHLKCQLPVSWFRATPRPALSPLSRAKPVGLT